MPTVARVDPRNRSQGGEGRNDERWQSTNKPRAVRVEEELWSAVKERTQHDGYDTLNEGIVALFEWYVSRPKGEGRL